MARAEANSSQVKEKAAQTRAENLDFARWAEGYGVIRHTDATQLRIREMDGDYVGIDTRSRHLLP